MKSFNLPDNYQKSFLEIKNLVLKTRNNSLRKINKELITLYWNIGKMVWNKTNNENWGKSIVEKLAKDLQNEFIGIKGFSNSNIWRMKQFYQTYKEDEKLAQLVRELPWGHNIILFSKLKNKEQIKFYVKMSIQKGWSRFTLIDNIKFNIFEKYKNNQNNFKPTIDKNKLAELKWEFKDEYNLEFLNLEEEHKEKELEDKVVKNIVQFLAEMGGNFAFVGR